MTREEMIIELCEELPNSSRFKWQRMSDAQLRQQIKLLDHYEQQQRDEASASIC